MDPPTTNQSKTAGIDPATRRPIRSRQMPVFDRSAQWLADRGVSPNVVSASSVVAALAGACLMVGAGASDGVLRFVLLLAAAAMVQLRLVSNLLDGMVAERAGAASRLGRLYNEAPDRISDMLFLIGFGTLGHSASAMFLGALGAGMAVLTAYVRGLAAEVGARPSFVGPMAKPQRMAVLTVALLLLAGLPGDWAGPWWGGRSGGGLVETALLLIIVGAAATCVRRWRGLTHHAAAADREHER